jgi:hypothetical protein
VKSIVIEGPKPTKSPPQNICMGKGDDFPEVDALVENWGYGPHRQEGRRPVDEEEGSELQSEEVGSGEDELLVPALIGQF